MLSICSTTNFLKKKIIILIFLYKKNIMLYVCNTKNKKHYKRENNMPSNGLHDKKINNNFNFLLPTLMDAFEPINLQTILIHNFEIKFGVPPAPTVEGRKKRIATFPSTFLNKIVKSFSQKSPQIHLKDLKKFGMESIPNDEKYITSHKASL